MGEYRQRQSNHTGLFYSIMLTKIPAPSHTSDQCHYIRHMSSLIPTPRTDKNGRTVIRHMKADAKRIGSKLAHAAPVLPNQETQVSLIDLVEMADTNRRMPDFSPVSKEIKVQAATLLHEIVPDAAPLLTRLAEIGTPTAVSLACEAYDHSLSSIVYAFGLDKPQLSTGNTEHEANRTAIEYVKKHTLSQMRSAWNFGNVMEDLGTADPATTSFVYGRYRQVVEKEVKRYDSRFNPEKASDNYWRGIAVFTATDVEDYSPEGEIRAKAFIKWAGKRKDIALITAIAKERETVDIETIQQVLDAGNDASALMDGAL